MAETTVTEVIALSGMGCAGSTCGAGTGATTGAGSGSGLGATATESSEVSSSVASSSVIELGLGEGAGAGVATSVTVVRSAVEAGAENGSDANAAPAPTLRMPRVPVMTQVFRFFMGRSLDWAARCGSGRGDAASVADLGEKRRR